MTSMGLHDGLDALSWPFAPSRKGYNGRAARAFR